MTSKWCPKCERITSCSSMPNYCAWGCGSLADEPILPDYSEWTRLGGYNGVVEYARNVYKERQTKKEPLPMYLGNGETQMRLF